jgi:hypothetical protein
VSKYEYPQSKVIDKVTFITSENDACRAYLHATNTVDKETLKKVVSGIIAQGWNAIPFTLDGVPVLEVRGIKKNSEFTNYLRHEGLVSGPHTFTKDPPKKLTFMDKVRKRSLQATGGFFVLADAGFVYYGYREKRWEDVAAGFAYMAGSAVMGLFGHSDQSRFEIREQSKRLLKYAKEYDLKIDPNDAINAVSQSKGKTLDLFREYPAEIGNTLTGLAGTMIAWSAARSRVFKKFDAEQVGRETLENNAKIGKILKPEDAKLTVKELGEKTIRKKRFAGKLDIGLGTTTLAAGMTGAYVKEKVKDPDAPKSHGVQSVIDWVREKPLRVAGFGYMISTLCHSVSTAVEYKDAKMTQDVKSVKAVPGRVLFIVSTIIGEILLTISSKGHGEGVKQDHSTDNSIIAVTAELVANQPEGDRPALIKQLSKFLGRPEVLAIKDEQAENLLREQVERMSQNPWAISDSSTAPKPVEPVQHTANTRTPKPLPDWQAKVSAPKDPSTEPQLST